VSGEDAVIERLRAVLDELAAEETAALVEEARIEARARVRALLAEALAERMLARAEHALADGDPVAARQREPRSEPRRRAPAAPRRAADRERREPPPTTQQGWYVYGIVEESFEAPPMLGVDDEHGLEVVPAAGLAALTSRVPLAVFGEPALQEQIEDLAWLERHARRHEQILESVREQRATVVPMRLFTIYESTDSLRDTLERERSFLLEALARLAGRTEWGVKLFADPAAARPAEEPEADDAGPGESYLLRRRAVDRRTEESAEELHERAEHAHARLAAAAVEARVNPLQPPELSEHEGTMVMNGVYLVDNDVIEGFSAEVTSLREEYAGQGFDVILTGPWPPYNFVNSSQEAEV
jgi:hypothetical protein